MHHRPTLHEVTKRFDLPIKLGFTDAMIARGTQVTNNNRTSHWSGYIEGYYGQLLDWPGRHALLDVLGALGMNGYVYAPKDDAAHRYSWRTPYDESWRQNFADFAVAAQRQDVRVIAGIAPGLDFNFADIDVKSAGDFQCLVEKARRFCADGASHIALLMDDIAADFATRAGDFSREGTAHAILANRLADAIDQPVIVVPRIYADSLITPDDPQSMTYLADLTSDLAAAHPIVYCGNDIVAQNIAGDKTGHIAADRLIIWDNFYANDYCPRRLFLGPWRRPDRYNNVRHNNIMLNPTGLLETDKLLLRVMHDGLTHDGDNLDGWRRLLGAEVPPAFFTLACYFDAPFGFAPYFPTPAASAALAALEELLWRWKSPLQREWYPVLMGLKQDLFVANGQLPAERIAKTQTMPLAQMLGKISDTI